MRKDTVLRTDGCDKVAPGTSLGSHSKELETPTTRVSKFVRKNGEEGTFEDWGALIIKEFLHKAPQYSAVLPASTSHLRH